MTQRSDQKSPTRPELALILASKSLYKQDQLRKLAIDFKCIDPSVNETPLPNETADNLARRLALAKAKAVAQHVEQKKGLTALVLGCDQTAVCNKLMLGKPHTRARAFEQLSHCSGNVVRFYSAIALLNTTTGEYLEATVNTLVHFRTLEKSQINDYLDKENTLDCAGSFKSEGLGIALFESVTSHDPSALIGLPLIATCQLLREHGFRVL